MAPPMETVTAIFAPVVEADPRSLYEGAYALGDLGEDRSIRSAGI